MLNTHIRYIIYIYDIFMFLTVYETYIIYHMVYTYTYVLKKLTILVYEKIYDIQYIYIIYVIYIT